MNYYNVRVLFQRTDSGYLVEANLPGNDSLKDHYTINPDTLSEDIEAMTSDLKPRLEAKLEEIESREL